MSRDLHTTTELDAGRLARFDDDGPRYAGIHSTEPVPGRAEAARDAHDLGEA